MVTPTHRAAPEPLMIFVRNAVWAILAGAFIPVMAVLNARLGRTLGEPLHASVALFAVALLAASAVSVLLTGRLPAPAAVLAAPPLTLAGGAIVAFYVISVTLLAPRFGVGNVILFVMTAQILTAASIDHFALFGAPRRPVGALRLTGLAILLAGLAVTQAAATRTPQP